MDITCLAFLDDYMTPSRDHDTINHVLEAMRSYGEKWDVRWALDKFRVLSFNSDPGDETWTYEHTTIRAVTQHKYLSVIHSTKKPFWNAHFSEKLMVAQYLFFSLRKSGLLGGRNAPGASLNVVRRMIWQAIDHGRATARSLDYGHGTIRKKLAAFQISVLREVLGLSKSAPILAILGESGDLPDAWRERWKQMQIAKQMLSADPSSIAHKVAQEANTAVPKIGIFLRISKVLADHDDRKRDIADFESKKEIKTWIARRAADEWMRGIAASTRLFKTYA